MRKKIVLSELTMNVVGLSSFSMCMSKQDEEEEEQEEEEDQEGEEEDS